MTKEKVTALVIVAFLIVGVNSTSAAVQVKQMQSVQRLESLRLWPTRNIPA